MIDLLEFEKSIHKINANCYIFMGTDENLIKKCVDKLKNKVLDNTMDESFKELNYIRLDGEKVEYDELFNICETLPFMTDKKLVEVFRANFLVEKDNKRMEISQLKKYIKELPPSTILAMYYIFDNPRDKVPDTIKNIKDNNVVVVKVDKLKGAAFQNRIKDIFDKNGVEIGKAELTFLCLMVDNNMEVAEKECEKLICYTMGREIKKEDINKIITPKSDNDIFNLVDYISQKNIKKSIDILNELIFKGEKPLSILAMIERQFKLLLTLRMADEERRSREEIIRELRLNPYIGEKMIAQSKKFSMKALKENLNQCILTEKTMKSSSAESKILLELLILKSAVIK